jgi:hypothetical protein
MYCDFLQAEGYKHVGFEPMAGRLAIYIINVA